MNILSDSESSDSDTGRRYKTESTRAKEFFFKEMRCENTANKNVRNNRKCEKRELFVSLNKNQTSKRQKQYENRTKESEKIKDGNRFLHKNNSLKNDDHQTKKTHDERDRKFRSDSETYEEVRSRESLSNDNEHGPSLPPHMLKINQDTHFSDIKTKESQEKIYGPSLPSHYFDKGYSSKRYNNVTTKDNELSESDDELIGPVPNCFLDKNDSQLQQRALELKLSKLNSSSKKDSDNKIRDIWMTELPELRRVNDLQNRQFKTKDYDNNKDRSIWTDTPSDRKKKFNEKTHYDLKKMDREKMEKVISHQRDYEQEAIAKKHKRDESLLDIHQKNIKKKIKSLKNIEPVERRPFSRDSDLKVNRFDESLKKTVLKKAQLLDTRFNSGQTKYL
ncbi:GPALPP motifs-containing protein 1 [Contarinia nasturtii]|uniref:GPALPP motifs-containing protein 1 n=1 Tax=Contarinia nasturtii TaxID=265458 RepID=UPI0012D49FBE|nr:GPALPP motifs-containing protein 1 [Contarinia nasturtii]